MTTTVTPYLSFPGTTREAYAFYAKALGATIETMMSYADMPATASCTRAWRCPGAPWSLPATCRPACPSTASRA